MAENYYNKLRSRNSKWNRISKKHINALNIKTGSVNRFLNARFIDRNEIRYLNQATPKTFLDPMIVMNLRHEMFQRGAKKSHIPNINDISLTKFKNRNRLFEDSYIQNQLNQFKAKIKKNNPINNLRPKLCFDLNNQNIYKSLNEYNHHLVNFFGGKCDALNKSNAVMSNENLEKFRTVRFQESVQIISYVGKSPTISEISEDLNSDFTEDINNGDMEAEVQIFGKQFDIMKVKGNAAQNFNEIAESRKETLINSSKLSINEDLITIKKIQQKSQLKLNADVHCEGDDPFQSASDSEFDEQDNILLEIFQPIYPPKEILMKKYFLKWMHFATLEKLEKQNLNNKRDRIKQINAFLNKINKEKKAIFKSNNNENESNDKKKSTILTKKYQNKIKVQQDIIDFQKIKLERQEKLIMELKLSKLLEETKQNKEEIKYQLKTVIKTGEVRNQTKAKCLQFVGNFKHEEKVGFSKLEGKSIMVPKFLVAMQERALERSIKHELAKQRRLHLEAEKEAAKYAAEEAKRFEDEQTKRNRIGELKEKRRQEKLAKILKEKERERGKENNKKCQELNRKRLLRNLGMHGFKMLIIIKGKNQRRAEGFYKQSLQKQILLVWKSHTDQILETKYRKSDILAIKLTKKAALRNWCLYYRREKSKMLLAIDWYELKLSGNAFQQWIRQTQQEKLTHETKIKQADSHYIWHMKWKVLDCWQRLPQIINIERETEKRRQRWRIKIWELLPDYNPGGEHF